MKTYSPKAAELQAAWWVVDAEGLVLGRLATAVAAKLRGKDKPTFAPHMDGAWTRAKTRTQRRRSRRLAGARLRGAVPATRDGVAPWNDAVPAMFVPTCGAQ